MNGRLAKRLRKEAFKLQTQPPGVEVFRGGTRVAHTGEYDSYGVSKMFGVRVTSLRYVAGCFRRVYKELKAAHKWARAAA